MATGSCGRWPNGSGPACAWWTPCRASAATSFRDPAPGLRGRPHRARAQVLGVAGKILVSVAEPVVPRRPALRHELQHRRDAVRGPARAGGRHPQARRPGALRGQARRTQHGAARLIPAGAPRRGAPSWAWRSRPRRRAHDAGQAVTCAAIIDPQRHGPSGERQHGLRSTKWDPHRQPRPRPEVRYTWAAPRCATSRSATSRNWAIKTTGDKVQGTGVAPRVFYDRLARDRRREPEEGPFGLRRGTPDAPKVAGQGADPYCHRVIADNMADARPPRAWAAATGRLRSRGACPHWRRLGVARAGAASPAGANAAAGPAAHRSSTSCDVQDDDIPVQPWTSHAPLRRHTVVLGAASAWTITAQATRVALAPRPRSVRRVLLDFSGVAYIQQRRPARADGRGVRRQARSVSVAPLQRVVAEIFAISRFDKVLAGAPDVEAALAQCPRRRWPLTAQRAAPPARP